METNFLFVYIFMQENVFNQTSLPAIENQFRREIKEHNVTESRPKGTANIQKQY